MAEVKIVEVPVETVETVVEPAKPEEMDVRQMVLSFLDAAEAEETDAFLTVMADFKAIWMAAKDLHYNAKGDAFYGVHLLADMVADTEKFFDDLAEVYYLGEKGVPPPKMRHVMKAALNEEKYSQESADKVSAEEGADLTNLLVKRLMAACRITLADIEKAKTMPGLLAGTHAVLDEASRKLLVDIGLLAQTDK